MQWKIVIFIAGFSVASASVIIDKLVEDDPETQVKQAIEDYLQSDQYAQDVIADFWNPDLNAPDSKLFICKDRICNRICRILRFERGSCDNRRCKCFRKDAVTDADEGTDAETAMASYAQAEQSDVNLNKADGIEDSSTDIVDSTLEAPDSKLICKDRICNRLCRILRFERGSCGNRRCKCFRKDAVTNTNAETDAETAIADFNAVEETDRILNEDDDIEELQERDCNQYICNIVCIRSGNKGGWCLRKQCRCF